MNTVLLNKQRDELIGQQQHEFLYPEGYGAYTFITPKDAGNLLDCYSMHENNIRSAITQLQSQINVIRAFIKLI